MKKRNYPSHIYDSVRAELAVSYIQHEFRKLLWRVPENHWQAIDKDIADWMDSPQLDNPRDFWNGFHGICMGFKLKIGLIYFVTAENVNWKRGNIPVEDLFFGIEFPPTQVIKPGLLSAKEVIKFYADPENRKIREKELKITRSFSKGTPPRDKDPIIVTEKIVDGKVVLSVYEGNRRLIKAILEKKEVIPAFVGKFTSQEKEPKNYWISTSILMEIIYFAREAFERGDSESFQHYMAVLKDMLAKSESAVYELKERALIGKKTFREKILKELKLI